MKRNVLPFTYAERSFLWIAAVLLRVALLVYGEWHDANNRLKFTDIDYQVITDGAKYVELGQSPFLRSTYRYTPLLAWLMLPNIQIHPSCGKLIFVIGDLVAAYLINRITYRRTFTRLTWFLIQSLWLLNPFVAAISTRGNAESVVAVLVLATAELLYSDKITLAAVVYAFAVHFKIYPLIYSWPILVFLRDSEKPWFLPSRDQLKFTLISAGTFFLLTAGLYQMYGFEFLEHAYLYHVGRKDHRHNFSVYFYSTYLSLGTEASAWASLATFIPQLVLLVAIGAKFGQDKLIEAWFLQTFVFVSFNKVCTSQYFLWYLQLLPCTLPVSSMPLFNEGIGLALLWFLGQGLWLSQAYLLEMKGVNTFTEIWLASLLFFAINCFIIIRVVYSYKHKLH